MKKLVVLDYSDASVHIFDVLPDIEVDDEYVDSIGFNMSNCYWMLSDYLDIKYHHNSITLQHERLS